MKWVHAEIMNGLNLRRMGRVAYSVQRLATGWTVWGSNLVGARFFAPIQTGPGAHPAYCTMGTGCFPGVENGTECTESFSFKG
jgi:hypothetical protein